MMKDMIFGTIGGLALFLFGMGMLSEGLKKAAGNRLKMLLEKMTRHRMIAYLVGAGVTCLIQSSSATTVIVVGLVNAGLLTLKQAICVVLGANVGTTMTGWLVSGTSVFKITNYALPAVGIGFLISILGKRQQTKSWGQVLLGFGILFLGISFMKDGFASLKGHEGVRDVLIAIGHQPLLAILAGAIFTMLIQSSSASVMMIQVLAFSGAFGTDWHMALRVAIPFMLGDNIGTTITAQLAALRSNVNARRTAMAHTVFNVIGVVVALPLVYLNLFSSAVEAVTPMALTQKTIMLHIAVANTLFKGVGSLMFLPLVKQLEQIVGKIVRAKPSDLLMQPVTLDRNLLDTPPVAMDQARRELVRMAKVARSALDDAVAAIRNDDRTALNRVAVKEDTVDEFQTEITRYLVELSQRTLSPEAASELPVLLHTVNDVERIGDHAVNITEIAGRKLDQRLTFSQVAAEEMARMSNEVNQMFDDILAAIGNNDLEAANRSLKHEEAINLMQMEFRRSHVQRLGEGTCSAMVGLLFVDFVDNLEKIGDHLTNIAQGVLGGLQWDKKFAQKSTPADAEG